MDKLVKIISYYCNDNIDENFNLKDLQLNELDFFDFLMDIEDEFDISIDEEEFNELVSIKDLYNYIQNY